MNNSSIKGGSRAGSEVRCEAIAVAVKEVGGLLRQDRCSLCYDLGKFEKASDLLDITMPAEQVITHTPKQFLEFLAKRGRKRLLNLRGCSPMV